MTITVIKTLLIILILVVMVILLLSMDHLFNGKFHADKEDADELRHDIDNSSDVITNQNLLSELVEVSRPGSRNRK